jgi:hypothetical protein
MTKYDNMMMQFWLVVYSGTSIWAMTLAHSSRGQSMPRLIVTIIQKTDIYNQT